MASIKKIENKKGISYKIIVSNGYDMQGKKIVKTTTYNPDPSMTAKQQEKALAKYAMEFEERVKNGDCFDGDKLSFEEYTVKWLAYMKNNLAYSTYEGYVQLLNDNMIPYFKTTKIARIRTPMIEDFYESIINKYAYATVKKCANILSGMFKTAIRWQIIEVNPCTNAIIPKKSKKEVEIKYFTPKQSIMFLKSLDLTYETKYKGHYRTDDTGIRYYVDDYTESHKVATQYKVFYNISLFCGLRKGETLALHWSDIDFNKREISITKSVSKSESGVSYKDPKNYSSIRVVPIPQEIMPLLRQYKAEYNRLRISLGTAWQGDGNIFIQSDGKLMGRSTPYQYFVRHLKRYNEWVQENPEKAKEQGFEELPTIPLHGLRHSCATLLNYLKTDIITIASVLGHSQTSTTMNIYAHSFEEQTHIASDKLDEFIRMNAM
ncbi:tyrosine-type recombinase/integrase [Faecalimonas sp. LCP19S3_D12]